MDFEILNKIEKVEVSTSFKSKTLKKINNIKLKNSRRDEHVVYNWFTPKLQLASIALILLVNTTAVMYAFKDKESNSINNFAKEYSLKSASYLQIENF